MNLTKSEVEKLSATVRFCFMSFCFLKKKKKKIMSRNSEKQSRNFEKINLQFEKVCQF